MNVKIVKCTRTSRGPAWPGPKVVSLPDDEARALAAKGDVVILDEDREGSFETQAREQPRRMDRQMRRRITR